jgi:4-carboxymuconolactone decarboxylase
VIDPAADLAIVEKQLPQMAPVVAGALKMDGFAGEIGAHAVAMFANVWARPGLSARDRSLVTCAMLIALRQTEELRGHAGIALANGVTRTELEELVFQASAYAGFPAAMTARATIGAALAAQPAD